MSSYSFDSYDTEDDLSTFSYEIYRTKTSPQSNDEEENKFEIFQNDMAVYVNAFEDIERDTGLPLTYMHEMIINRACGTKGFTFKQEDTEINNTVEVEFDGAKDFIMCSVGRRSSYHEVDVPKTRKGLFRGLTINRSDKSKRSISLRKK